MSTTPNAFGTALGTATPFMALSAIGTPFGSFIKPGGRVAAYVRSTGRQDLDDNLVSDNLVQSINEGLKRCRSGLDDVVFVLPGHVETFTASGAIWPNLVAGAQIIGCGGLPGATNTPSVVLSNTGASIALNVANVTIAGLNISSATAAVTGAVVVTAAGCLLSGNYFKFTGALGANSPVQVTGAADFTMLGNQLVADSTAALVSVTLAASTNLNISGNLLRHTSTGTVCILLADTAGISGFICNNFVKTAAATTPATIITAQTANLIANVSVNENYGSDNVASSGVLSPAGAFT